MVKSYLRYEATGIHGNIVGTTASPTCVSDPTGRLAVSAACQDVLLWDWKKAQQVGCWRGEKSEVTCLGRSPDLVSYAVGYSDGTIKIWNIRTGSYSTVFNGHKGAVSSLAFDKQGARLVSGSKDTDIIVWDVIAETGMFRLRGHKDMVTDLRFIETGNQLISASKDSLIKLWDLQTQHCVQTLVGHRSEVWSLDVSPDETRLVTGSADKEIRVWNINKDLLGKQLGEASGEDEGDESQQAITFFGPVSRQGAERILTLRFNEKGTFVICQSSEKIVEIFKTRSEEEINKKLQRKEKRKKEKLKQKGEGEAPKEEEQEEEEEEPQATADLWLYAVATIRPPAKVKSVAFVPEDNAKNFKILVALHNNTIEIYSVDHSVKPVDASKVSAIELAGHRSDVRTVAISSDDQIFLSASNNSLKIWNMKSRACIRTMESGYALCSAFTPGNRQVILGTKTGDLEIFDISSSSLIRTVKAHSGAIWSLDISADGKQVVTGSADHDVKFWDFDLTRDEDEEETSPLRLNLVLARTLRMSDDVLAVRISPDGKFLAVSLLDTTVKVFYTDTLKFFLSLYGHKLPVMCIDISSDSTLIVTGSADKNVKIWGLDFGDCHKSIFAHDDTIMGIKFVPRTHYFFTASKDRTVKYWDGDKFENIMKLEGHLAEIWSLAISRDGDFILTGSHDRTIRAWERTSEQLFLEEEKEKELETMFEKDIENERDRSEQEKKEEADAASKKSIETIKAGEKILEAIMIAEQEVIRVKEYEEEKKKAKGPVAPFVYHPILGALGNLSPAQYVLHTFKEIRTSELDQALLVLPFAQVFSLFTFLEEWVRKGWQVELTCRTLFYLLKIHQNQIATSRSFLPVIDSIKTHVRELVAREKDLIGFNLAAMRFLKREWEDANQAEFFDVSKIQQANKPKKVKKRKVLAS